jgi:MoxR-like ATPase
VAFLAEIFRASSAILNSLLTLVNERVFHHGRHRDTVPLVGLIGASNELPDPEGGLGALYDRFLVRLAVPPVFEEASFIAVATGNLGAAEVDAADALTHDDLRELALAAESVEVPADLQAQLANLWRRARKLEWGVSDRRWRQAVNMLKTAAAADGRRALAPIDLLLLEPVLAASPDQIATVRDAVLDQIGARGVPPHDLRTQWLLVRSDRVAPSAGWPNPGRPAGPGWRQRLSARRDSVDAWIALHLKAVDRVAATRDGIELLANGHLWIGDLPPELLAPHIEAARDLAGVLRVAERYRAQLASPASLVGGVLGQLPTEDRIPAHNMDFVLAIGPDEAVGLSFRAWRRLPSPHRGPASSTIAPEVFLDWLEGTVSTPTLVDGVKSWEAREVRRFLDQLHRDLQSHIVPAPPALPAA